MEKFFAISSLVVDFYILAIFISILAFLLTCLGERFTVSPVERGRMYFIALISPPLVAGMFLFLSFMPSILHLKGSLMTCLSRVYCYIFPFIPEKSEAFYGLLTIGLSLLLFTVISLLLEGHTYMRGRRRILNNPGEDKTSLLKNFEAINRIKTRVTPVTGNTCFIMGYLSPVLVISKDMITRLSPEEIEGLLAHELAHHQRKDNILRLILNQCKNLLYIFPHTHILYEKWNKTIEMISDEMAARETGRPLDIASALIKVHRMGRLKGYSYLSAFQDKDRTALEDRVERLIFLHDRGESLKTPPSLLLPSEGGFLFSLIIMGFTLFFTLFETDPFFLHCHLARLVAS